MQVCEILAHKLLNDLNQCSQILFLWVRLLPKLSKVSSLRASKLRVSGAFPRASKENSFILSAKHFINNEQEHFRELGSSNVDARYDTTISNLTATHT